MDGAGDAKTLIWGAWTTHQQLSKEELEGRATRDRGEAWIRVPDNDILADFESVLRKFYGQGVDPDEEES